MIMATYGICILNIFLSFTRMRHHLKERHLISLAWIIILYHSVLLAINVIEGPFIHLLGYSGKLIRISVADKLYVSIYVFLANICFAVAESVIFRICPTKAIFFVTPYIHAFIKNRMLPIYCCILFISGFVTSFTFYNLDYTGYVTYSGSAWSFVVLQWSTSAIVFAVILHKYFLSFLCTIPFLYLSLTTQVRSFVFFPIISAIVAIIVFNVDYSQKYMYYNRLKIFVSSFCSRIVFSGGIALLFLALLFAGLDWHRNNKFTLPEQILTRGMMIVFAQSYDIEYSYWRNLQYLGDALTLPYRKIFARDSHHERSWRGDRNAEQAAVLYFGARPSTFNHNPYLWYTDSYISFGQYGFILGLLWGVLFVFFEKLICKNLIIFSMFLPYYLSSIYLIIRGASDNAISAYPIWIQIFVYIFILIFCPKIKYNMINKSLY